MSSKTIFEKSQKEIFAYSLPKSSKAFEAYTPEAELLRQDPIPLPEVSELDLTRHFTGLAQNNIGIDNCFYPLGSCTMKLNPRVNEWAASLPSFARTHPYAPDQEVQGNLQLIHELSEFLAKLSGMAATSLVPNAGAQGELTGLMMIAAYHAERGDHERNEILVPDSAHGTNPATASMAGFKIISIPSGPDGDIDLGALRSNLSEKTAGLMLTNPNTLGLFSRNILKISSMVHEAGGLLYYDGANLNAIMNVARPGDMGFDVMHINLHKTFSTPHGGGGPGSGPVCCNERLKKYLPVPYVTKNADQYQLVWNSETSIGQMASFHGNFGIYLRAYLYAKLHGQIGLRRISETAVLNANYLKEKLKDIFTIPFSEEPCMHEFVVQADTFIDKGIKALDIAKRLLDYGIHAPTVYFPLIIKECMLIEPTESESKNTLDHFITVLKEIAREAVESPDILLTAPHTTSRSRLDEVKAAKNPVFKHTS